MTLDPDKLPLATKHKVRLLLLAANAMFLYWLVTAAHWSAVPGIVLMYLLYSKIGGEIGMHRYFCHRSFKAKPWAEKLFLVLNIPVSFGSAFSWVATHRMHHHKEDMPEDPHSPYVIGGFRVWMLLLGNDWHVGPQYIKDLMRDKTHVFIHRNYFKLYAACMLGFGVIAAVCGWQWLVYLWAAPVALTMHFSSMVNVVCHKWGYRRYETEGHSTNNLFINWILLGNGLHNNHHGRPSDYRLSTPGVWYEIDFWGWMIKHVFMEKPGDIRSRPVAS